VKDLAVGDRPQERLERLGARSLSDTELIALLLRSGSRGYNVIAVAQGLLAAGGGLPGLVRWTPADFRRLRGIGRVKAVQLVTVMEVARRILASAGDETALLNNPDAIVRLLAAESSGLEVEKFWVLCLNRKNRLIKQVEVTSGTATSSLAHPREVFREAVRHGATAVICAHNHPSGDPAPSAADIQVTRQLREAARALDIELLDHVIIGRVANDPRGVGHYSFRQAGIV
jgi:DNA repair protein RadC